MNRYPSPQLRGFIAEVLTRFGMAPQDAEVSAEVLHDADLTGIDTHGIALLAPHAHQAAGIKNGEVEVRPTVTVLRDSPVAAAWDSGNGYGQLIAYRAMQAAIAKAEQSGIGMVTVRNARHFGANAYFAEMAALRNMIGMVSSNTPSTVFPPNGYGSAVGTNPFAFAAPVVGRPPLVFDISMTAISGSRILNAIALGEQIPQGWVIDSEGRPTTDPNAIRAGGSLELLGGPLAGHKGFSLALMIDTLGILAGNGSGLWQMGRSPHWSQGQWFAAWRIDLFIDPDDFQTEMRRVADHIHSLTPRPGSDAVLLPGERRAASRIERATKGVPIRDDVVIALQKLAAETGAPFPDPIN